MNEHHYIACDLGAESGRVILGRLSGGRVTLEEVHRFPNGAVRIAGSLRWAVLRIFEELKIGLRKVAARRMKVESFSVDSWGLDYVLSGAGQPMLSLPYHYRDGRTDRTYAAALRSPGAELIFAETGIQFMPINTLYHLLAERDGSPCLLEIAERFLTIADYLHFLFSGVAVIEESLASTTQLYNPATRAWSERLISEFALPRKIFPPIVPSGTRLGGLLPEVAAELGVEACEVIATCSHDTGAAVAAVPATGEDWAYLSSGTWSLIGVELPAPLLTAAARAHNFTNEAGFGGTTRFLKNIVGLWLLQECRRTWALDQRNYDYATFDDYLSALRHKLRKQVKRERRELAEQGVEIVAHEGDDIPGELFEPMYRIYATTVDKHVWGRRYLTPEFVGLLRDRFRRNLCFLAARRHGELVAGTFNVRKSGVLYGRYWGAFEGLRFLHFNVCYYATIEHCIRTGLERFEPGAGGDFKWLRGFDAEPTASLHWVRDERLSRAIEHFLVSEGAEVDRVIGVMRDRSQLKHDDIDPADGED